MAGFRFSVVMAVLCAVGPAQSETLTSGVPGLNLVKTASECVLTIGPQEEPASSTPKLLLSAEQGRAGRSARITLSGREGEPGGILQVVVGDRRFKFSEAIRVEPRDLSLPPVLKALLERRVIHLTEIRPGPTYASVAIQQPRLVEALAAMQKVCGVVFEALTPVSAVLAAQERDLKLTRKQLRHVVYVLNSRFSKDVPVDPPISSLINDRTRENLKEYRLEKKSTPSKFLDSHVVKSLMRESFSPITLSYADHPSYRRHRDWFQRAETRGSDRTCILSTTARSVRGGVIWRFPEIRVLATAAGARGQLLFDVLNPRLLDLASGRSRIEIDGWSATLAERGGYAVPVKATGAIDTGLIRALRRGTRVALTGPLKETGETIRLEFSALGFTSGFKGLMSACGRPDLKLWLK